MEIDANLEGWVYLLRYLEYLGVMKKTKETSIEIADSIFKLLVEADYKQLEKIKDNYDVWSDLNDKFNS